MISKRHSYAIYRVNTIWVLKILEIIQAESYYPVEEIVAKTESEGISFSKRRDAFSRLADLDLLETRRDKNFGTVVRLTPKGIELKNVAIKNPDRAIEYIHVMHIVASFQQNKPRYFVAYRIITNLIAEQTGANSELYIELIRRLEVCFPEEIGFNSIDKFTINRASPFIKHIIPDFKLRLFVAPIMFWYGIQEYLYVKTGEAVGQILVTPAVVEDWQAMFLLNPTHLPEIIDRTVNFTDGIISRHSLAGQYLTVLKGTPLR